MPNTFLNTGRTVRATSNPQANVEQVQPTNAQTPTTPVQPVQNNNVQPTNTQTQQTQSSSNNAINPITIPIQIQPTQHKMHNLKHNQHSHNKIYKCKKQEVTQLLHHKLIKNHNITIM